MARDSVLEIVRRRPFESHSHYHYKLHVLRAFRKCRPYCIVQREIHNDQLYTMDVDGVHEFLITSGRPGTLKIYQMNPESESNFLKHLLSFETGQPQIDHVRWYLEDSGMFAFTDGSNISVFQTNAMKEVMRYDSQHYRTRFKSLAFHPHRSSIMAFGCIEDKFHIVDLRQETLPRFAHKTQRHSKSTGDNTHILWDPLDPDALWIGNSSGQIFLFDIRSANQSVYVHPAPSHLPHPLLTFMSFTPDANRLVTCHGVDTKLRVLKYGRDSAKRGILAHTNIEFSSPHPDYVGWDAFLRGVAPRTIVSITALLTNEEIYLPNTGIHPRDHKVYVFDLETGQPIFKTLEKTDGRSRTFAVISSYGQTCRGDEIDAAIIYGGTGSLQVQKGIQTTRSRREAIRPDSVYSQSLWSDSSDSD